MAVRTTINQRSRRFGGERASILEVTFDRADLAILEKELRAMPSKIGEAKASAINKTASKGRTAISREVRAKVNIKAKTANSRIKVSKKARKSQDSPSAVIKIIATKIPLIQFGGRPSVPPNQKGVPVARRTPRGGAGFRITKGGVIKRSKKLFVQRVNFGGGGGPSGNIHILQRENDESSGRPRVRFGPSIPEALGEVGIRKISVNLASELRKQVVSQVDRFLKRGNRGNRSS